MELTIILILLVIGGFVLIGYRMNKDKNANINKEKAMKDGRELREEKNIRQ